jgi:hypothetical protein
VSLGRTLPKAASGTNSGEQPPSAFFQDANYHDQIVKEQSEPAVHQAPSARDPVASRKTPITGHILGHRHGQRFVPNNRSGPQPTAGSRPHLRYQYDATNRSVQWHRLALHRKLAEPHGNVKHREKYRKNQDKNLDSREISLSIRRFGPAGWQIPRLRGGLQFPL